MATDCLAVGAGVETKVPTTVCRDPGEIVLEVAGLEIPDVLGDRAAVENADKQGAARD